MLKIKKGDNVQIMVGKDAGKTGSVERVSTKDMMILVNGLNLFKRHVRRFQGMEGGIIDMPKPVKVANLALVCPNCKKPTRVGFIEKDGVKNRVCRKCGKEINK